MTAVWLRTREMYTMNLIVWETQSDDGTVENERNITSIRKYFFTFFLSCSQYASRTHEHDVCSLSVVICTHLRLNWIRRFSKAGYSSTQQKTKRAQKTNKDNEKHYRRFTTDLWLGQSLGRVINFRVEDNK